MHLNGVGLGRLYDLKINLNVNEFYMATMMSLSIWKDMVNVWFYMQEMELFSMRL